MADDDTDEAFSYLPTSPITWFPTRLIRFYIELPDPLPLHDQFPYVRTVPAHPGWLIKESGVGRVLPVPNAWLEAVVRYADRAVAAVGRPVATDPPSERGPQVHPGYFQFYSVVRLWLGSVPDPSLRLEGMLSFAQVWHKHNSLLAEEDEVVPEVPAEALKVESHRNYTVAEIVVPLLAEENDEDEEKARGVALRKALDAVVHMQRSLYVIWNRPLRISTQETLPVLVWYETGSVNPDRADSLDFPVDEWVPGLHHANNKLLFNHRGDEPTREDYEQYDSALYYNIQTGPFSEYQEFRRRAHVALERDGAYAESIIWSAAGAEYVLDELLRMILWETSKSPRAALDPFKPLSISQRVKGSYAALAGTAWDLKTPGPIVDWLHDVARIRNRIVHQVYVPHYDEAVRAMDLVVELVTHIGDLLAAKIGTFFRTAWLVCGENGLRNRGKWEQFEQFRDAAAGPDWIRAFVNWRMTHLRLMEDRFGARVPDEARAIIFFVYGTKNRGFWAKLDRETMQAIRVDVDESTLDERGRPALDFALDGSQRFGPGPSAFIEFEKGVVASLKSHKPWREAHELLPPFTSMVDGSDIADQLFTWRPSWSLTPPGPTTLPHE